VTPTTDRIGDGRDDADTPGDETGADGAPCPTCGTPRPGAGRFCESCGCDLDDPGPTLVGWVAEVVVDPGRVGDDGLVAPAGRPLIVIPIDDGPVTIGRRHRDDEPPATIDLSGDRADPGVSRRHATIEQDAGGTWWLTDAGSTNGTTVDDDDRPIPPHLPVPLAVGSRIHVGAWTTITLRPTG